MGRLPIAHHEKKSSRQRTRTVGSGMGRSELPAARVHHIRAQIAESNEHQGENRNARHEACDAHGGCPSIQEAHCKPNHQTKDCNRESHIPKVIEISEIDRSCDSDGVRCAPTQTKDSGTSKTQKQESKSIAKAHGFDGHRVWLAHSCLMV